MQKIHKSVFLIEASEGIVTTNIKDIYIDVTFGSGGHTKELLKILDSESRIIALDQDYQSIINNYLHDHRLKILHKDFRYIENILRIQGIFKISGVLADLGVSFHQLETPERGFSIRSNNKLDMRMDQRSKKSAKDILNNYSRESLTNIFFSYGELRNSKNLAKNIVYKRKNKKIETTIDLIESIKNEFSNKNKQKILTKIFQALRIEANDELTSIKFFLKSVIKILKKGGKIAVISYHSLEDRLVKQFFKNGCFKKNPKEDFFGKKKSPFIILTKKPISPKEIEIKNNHRARSARLRIVKKK